MLYGTPLIGAKNTEEFGTLLPTHLLDVIYTNFEPLKINEKNVVQINEDELPRFLPEIDKIIKDGKYATQEKLVNVANKLVAYLPDMRRYLAAILYNDGVRFDNNFNSLRYDFMVLFKQISYDKFKLITKYWISEVEKVAKKIDVLLQNTVMIMTQMAFAVFEAQEKSVMWPILTKILVYQNLFMHKNKNMPTFVDTYTQWFIDTLGSIKKPSKQEIEQKSQIAKFCRFTDLSLITQNYRWLQSILKDENDGGMRKHVGLRWYTQISFTSIWIAEVFTPFFEEAKDIFVEKDEEEKIDHPLYQKAKQFYTEVHNSVEQDFEILNVEDLDVMSDIISDIYQDKDLDKQKQQKAREVAQKLNNGYEIETLLFLFESANIELQIAYDQAPRKAKFENIGVQTLIDLTKKKRKLQEDIDFAYDKILKYFYLVDIEFINNEDLALIFDEYKNSPDKDIEALRGWCDKNIKLRFTAKDYTNFVQKIHEAFLTYWEKVAKHDKTIKKEQILKTQAVGKDTRKLQIMQTEIAMMKNMKVACLKRIFQFIWKNLLQQDFPTDVELLDCIQAYKIERGRAKGNKNILVKWFLNGNYPFDLPRYDSNRNQISHDTQKVNVFIRLLEDYIIVEEDLEVKEKECSDYLHRMGRARTWFKLLFVVLFFLMSLATCYRFYAFASRELPRKPQVCYGPNPDDCEDEPEFGYKANEEEPFLDPDVMWPYAPWNLAPTGIYSVFNSVGFFSSFVNSYTDYLELTGVKDIDKSTFSLHRMLHALLRGDKSSIGLIFWKTVGSLAKFGVVATLHLLDILSIIYIGRVWDASPQPDLDKEYYLAWSKLKTGFYIEAAYFSENLMELQEARRDALTSFRSTVYGFGGLALTTFIQGPTAVIMDYFGVNKNTQNNQAISQNREQYTSIIDPNSNIANSRPKIEVIEDEKQIVVLQKEPKNALPPPQLEENWYKKQIELLQAKLEEKNKELQYKTQQEQNKRHDRARLQIAPPNVKGKEEYEEEEQEQEEETKPHPNDVD